MAVALHRNPLLKIAARFWWAPALVLLMLGIVLGGYHALTAAGVLLGGAGGLWASLTMAARRRTAVAMRALHEERAEAGLEFVCPHCLVMGEIALACPGCRRPVASWLAATGGEIAARCEGCGGSIAPETLAGAQAVCVACDSVGDAAHWHGRSACIVGVLTEADFEAFDTVLSGEHGVVNGLNFARKDDGARWFYALNLSDLRKGRSTLPAGHAASRLNAIWIGEADPLSAAEAVDRLALRTGLSRSALAKIRLCVAADHLDAATERALSARISRPEYGVAARALVLSTAPRPPLAAAPGHAQHLDPAPTAHPTETIS